MEIPFLVFVYLSITLCSLYVGHPISSDNGLLSHKLFLKSELYYQLEGTVGIAYSCLKYGVFITTGPDAI